MIYVLYFLASVLGLIILMTLIGLLLPKKHSSKRSTQVNASPSRVFQLLTAAKKYPEWRSEVKSIELLNETGTEWKESTKFGEMTLKISAQEPPEKLIITVGGEGLPFGGVWTFDLEAKSGGTEVTLAEDGEIYPPLFRFISRFIIGNHRTVEVYLSQVKKALEKK